MPLSAVAVRAAKGREKPYKLADGGGLYLQVVPSGSRYWRMNYRFGRKQATLSFGIFPEISLANAREKRDAMRKLLVAGIDPVVWRKQQNLAIKLAAANTFRAVADEWVGKIEREGRSPVTVDKIRWLLGFAYPDLGERPIADISTTEVLAVLRTVEGRGRHESAKRMRSVCGRVFRYAIATGRASHDLAADLRGALTAPKVKHRAAITEERQVGALLRAIEGFDGHEVTRLALRLAPHVFVRPGELRHAEWTEIDADKAIWTITDTKTKMRRPHNVPLSRQALAIIADVRAITGSGRYLFPGFQSVRRPMSENTINGALRRLGYDGTEMTGHGFRAMASTLLNESGKWHPDAIERQLAHVENNGVRRAYARGEHWPERVRMMQIWSDTLDQLRDGARILTLDFGSAARL